MIRTRLSRLLAAMVLIASSMVATSSVAEAYPGTYQLLNSGTSTYNIVVRQAYSNEQVHVAPNHWSHEYGNKANNQTVNSILLGAQRCVATYKRNVANTVWNYSGYILNPYGVEKWISVPNYPFNFQRGKNMVVVRTYSSGSGCP